ncbi:PREDICTED: RING finger protein 37 [Polistes dominula]|uniref:RING finger protein 37 n=1 Tax=Polistes dominula TaxID=743375 RepID=A0ABM1I6W4_POLDO|nr:PREDICTED: RING finger protein 37 [Polistes dominula]
MLQAVLKNKKETFMNFCAPCLQPKVTCDTISTEGYEVTNLIEDPCKGFLAYSCIKPPVQIVFTFPCNIQIHHICIWPSVGSQKSSGFQVYAKTDNDFIPYTLLSSGCLSANDNGVLFYAANVNPANISVPPNFLKRYIKGSAWYTISQTKSLKVSIFRTQSSVPALGKIEVWGSVSPNTSRDIIRSVEALWSSSQTPVCLPTINHQSSISATNIKDVDMQNTNKAETSLEVPDCFLDAITYEIMTQPIMLPSGKIIDQITLEKHGKSEASWGRSLSDPFTGLPFNEIRRPTIVTALKARIDKFLLEHSNMNEIKRLPRVLGGKSSNQYVAACQINRNTREANSLTNSSIKINNNNNNLQINNAMKRKSQCHRLPITTIQSKTVPYAKRFKMSNVDSLKNCNNDVEIINDKQIHQNNVDSDIDDDVRLELSCIKRFSTPKSLQLNTSILNNCNCCTYSILYKLPCNHVVCRRILTTSTNNQCQLCGLIYQKSTVERIHN